MSKYEKLISKLKSNPKDFTYDELKILKPYQIKNILNELKKWEVL